MVIFYSSKTFDDDILLKNIWFAIVIVLIMYNQLSCLIYEHKNHIGESPSKSFGLKLNHPITDVPGPMHYSPSKSHLDSAPRYT